MIVLPIILASIEIIFLLSIIESVVLNGIILSLNNPLVLSSIGNSVNAIIDNIAMKNPVFMVSLNCFIFDVCM